MLLGSGPSARPAKQVLLSALYRVLPSVSVVGRPRAVAGAGERAVGHADGGASVPADQVGRSDAAAVPAVFADLPNAARDAPVGDGFAAIPPVPSAASVPVGDGGVVAGLRAEVAGLRAALDGLRVAAPAPPCSCSLVVHGLMPCALEPEAYIAAFGAFCLHVLHLPDVPAVRDVRFFATAGRGPGAVVRLVAAQDAQAVLFAKQRLPGRSCVVSIDVSRGAAQRSLRARERCASRAAPDVAVAGVNTAGDLPSASSFARWSVPRGAAVRVPPPPAAFPRRPSSAVSPVPLVPVYLPPHRRAAPWYAPSPSIDAVLRGRPSCSASPPVASSWVSGRCVPSRPLRADAPPFVPGALCPQFGATRARVGSTPPVC